jgi:excisionase family DNA binding protein
MTTNHSPELPAIPTPKPAYTVDEVAALLGLHRVTVSHFVSKGELRVARLGHRTVRITHEALMDFLRAKEVAVPSQKPVKKKRGTKS